MKKAILISIIVLFVQILGFAQLQRVEIAGSQIQKLTSAITNQEYELQIFLPSGYDKTDKKFPVVYLMDSQWDFPLVTSIYGQQYYDGFIPEMIIVGVTWGDKTRLYAASDTEFYITSEFLNISFKKDNEQITGFSLERFGNAQFVPKVQ